MYLHQLKIFVGFLMVSLVFCIVTITAHAHPADGYPQHELHPNYGSASFAFPAEASVGDLQFAGHYPDPASLTDSEKYMIAGTTDSAWGTGLGPWWRVVFSSVAAYHAKHGYIPSRLSLDMILEMRYGGQANPEWDEVYRSPLHGDFPRLDAVNNSPGDLLIRVLSDSELQHISQYHPALEDLIYNGVDTSSGQQKMVELTSPVFLIRVHGYSGPIFESLMFATREL